MVPSCREVASMHFSHFVFAGIFLHFVAFAVLHAAFCKSRGCISPHCWGGGSFRKFFEIGSSFGNPSSFLTQKTLPAPRGGRWMGRPHGGVPGQKLGCWFRYDVSKIFFGNALRRPDLGRCPWSRTGLGGLCVGPPGSQKEALALPASPHVPPWR